MGFEERFAAAGRALDQALERLRDHIRLRRTGRGLELRERLSERAVLVRDHCQAAAGQLQARMQDRESVGRVRTTILVMACMALTAGATWYMASGRQGTSHHQNEWETMNTRAAQRDARRMGQAGTPELVRPVEPSGAR